MRSFILICTLAISGCLSPSTAADDLDQEEPRSIPQTYGLPPGVYVEPATPRKAFAVYKAEVDTFVNDCTSLDAIRSKFLTGQHDHLTGLGIYSWYYDPSHKPVTYAFDVRAADGNGDSTSLLEIGGEQFAQIYPIFVSKPDGTCIQITNQSTLIAEVQKTPVIGLWVVHSRDELFFKIMF